MELPEFKGGVNAVEAAVNEVPEYKGGVNDTTPPTVPGNPEGEAPNSTKPEASNGDALAQPSTPGVDFGQKAPKVKEPAKVEAKPAKIEAKNEKSLPNTGMNTSSTTALGLSLIGLIGLAVRRKLSK